MEYAIRIEIDVNSVHVLIHFMKLYLAMIKFFCLGFVFSGWQMSGNCPEIQVRKEFCPDYPDTLKNCQDYPDIFFNCPDYPDIFFNCPDYPDIFFNGPVQTK